MKRFVTWLYNDNYSFLKFVAVIVGAPFIARQIIEVDSPLLFFGSGVFIVWLVNKTNKHLRE